MSFEKLIEELSEEMKVPLKIDDKRACTLLINNSIKIRLEPDKSSRKILIASELGKTAAGSYRKEVLKEALKENGQHPRIAKLGYNQEANSLMLFEVFEIIDMNGLRLLAFLEKFVQKADSWKKALEQGLTKPH